METDNLPALRRLYGRHLPVKRLGIGVCAVCTALLAPGTLRCPAHHEAQVFIHLLDEEEGDVCTT